MNETIKLLRETANFSQNAIAQYLGISRQMYIKYEQGTVEPPVKIIKDLAKLYKVPYSWIIDGKVKTDKSVTYQIRQPEQVSVAEPAVALAVETPAVVQQKIEKKNLSSAGFQNTMSIEEQVLELLPKLMYSEKLHVMTRLCSILKDDTEKRTVDEKSEQRYEAFHNLLQLREELQLKTKGIKWTREELYERK